MAKTSRRTLLLLSLLLAGASDALLAQSGQVDVDVETRPIVQAYHVHSSIAIDGRLDEPVWQEAEAVADFVQFEPNEGRRATQRTEVRVLYDAGHVYVGALLYDENPDAIEPALGRRDEYNRADWFLVSIDSYFDKRTAYTFGVNAAGVQFDAIQTSSRRSGGGRR